MRARIIATDEIIDAEKSEERVGNIIYVVYRNTADSNECFNDYELDFDVFGPSDSDLRISVAKLREVLSCMKGNLLNDAVVDKIIKKVKSEI